MIPQKTQLVACSCGLVGALVLSGVPVGAQERSGSVPRDGFQLHYRVVGDRGPYVVALSGGPGLDVDYMASVAERLQGSYRVVLLEQRGTGRSRLPVLDERTLSWQSYLGDLEALRVGLGEDRLTLLGHSWGMTYGLAYAAAYPDRTRGVISLGSAPITADFMQLFDDNRSSRLHPSEREQLAYWSEPERRRADPDRALLEYLRAITPTDFWDRAKGIEHAMRWRLEWCHAGVGDVVERTIWAKLDLRPQLEKITAPVLIVHGYQDVAGEANVLEAARHISRAEVRFLHRAGHYPWLDQPDATWPVVLAFLSGLRP
jgi:proline iminopeptidase